MYSRIVRCFCFLSLLFSSHVYASNIVIQRSVSTEDMPQEDISRAYETVNKFFIGELDLTYDEYDLILSTLNSSRYRINPEISVGFVLQHISDDQYHQYIPQLLVHYMGEGKCDSRITALSYLLLRSNCNNLILISLKYLKSKDPKHSRPFREHYGAILLEEYNRKGWAIHESVVKELME